MVALLKMPEYLGKSLPDDERRIFPRKEFHAEVESKRIDHTVAAHRSPKMTLSLRDLSMGGLSAICPMPLNRGERLSVSFPPQGTLQPWSALGRVIRCEPSSLGYRVALEFDMLAAA